MPHTIKNRGLPTPLEKTLKKIKTIPPKYLYENEKNRNPAYFQMKGQQLHRMPENGAYIWVLNDKLNFITGVKNNYQKDGNTKWADIFTDDEINNKVDLNDPYGHVSLVFPEEGKSKLCNSQDLRAYAAGWFAQRKNNIELYLYSGRYGQAKTHSQLERRCIETYIANQLISAYGNQDIIFYDYGHDRQKVNYLFYLFANKLSTSKASKRVYTPNFVNNVLTHCHSDLDFYFLFYTINLRQLIEFRSNSKTDSKQLELEQYIKDCVLPLVKLIDKANTPEQIQLLFESLKQAIKYGRFKCNLGLHHLGTESYWADKNNFSKKQLATYALPLIMLIDKASTPEQIQLLCEAFEQQALINLIEAARLKLWKLISYFLKKSPPSKGDPENYGCALLRAANRRKWDLVDKLLAAEHIDLSWIYVSGDHKGYAAIHYLILNNKLDLLRKYQHKLNFNYQYQKDTPTPLTLAIQNDAIEVETLQHLFSQENIDINAKQNGSAPLHFAAANNNLNKVKLFITNKDSLKVKNKKNLTAVQIASRHGKWNFVEYFFDQVKPSKGDPEKYGHALLRAANRRKWDLVDKLLAAEHISLSINYVSGDHKGYAVIHYLVLNSKLDLLRKYQHKLNFNYQYQKDSPTPLTLAIQNDNLDGFNFKELEILTDNQLQYIFGIKGSLKGLGCILSRSIKVLGIPIEKLGAIGYLTIKQYTDAFLFCVKDDASRPKIKVSNILYDFQHLRLNEIKNEQFIQFTNEWLPSLYIYLRRKTAPDSDAIKKIESHIGDFRRQLKNYISPYLISNLIKVVSIPAIPSKFPTFFSSTLRQQYDVILEKRRLLKIVAPLNQNTFSIDNFYLAFRLASSTVFNTFDADSDIFRLYLSIGCLLIRIGYIKNHTLPDHLSLLEIGSACKHIENIPFEDLIIVGKKLGSAKFYNIAEIIAQLQKSKAFINPLDLQPFDDSEIQVFLKHPKIQFAIEKLHKLNQLLKEKIRGLEEITSQMKLLGESWWNVSTGSRRTYFNPITAYNALDNFLNFIRKCPTKLIIMINEKAYYLSVRNSNTSFKQLFSQMVYEGYSRQLGVALKQWVLKFEKEKNDIKQTIKPGAICFSQYLNQMPAKCAKIFELPSNYKLSGNCLAESSFLGSFAKSGMDQKQHVLGNTLRS